jgi:hypothetical protein
MHIQSKTKIVIRNEIRVDQTRRGEIVVATISARETPRWKVNGMIKLDQIV